MAILFAHTQVQTGGSSSLAPASEGSGARGAAALGREHNGQHRRVTSEVLNPRKQPCHAWVLKGLCKKGHLCKYMHSSLSSHQPYGELIQRCFVCGENGHLSRQCTCPGGGKHQNRHRKTLPKEAQQGTGKVTNDTNNKTVESSGTSAQPQVLAMRSQILPAGFGWHG